MALFSSDKPAEHRTAFMQQMCIEYLARLLKDPWT